MDLIDGLKWRYATKKFDATKKVSTEDVNKIKEAVQLSASSYGFQPYKVIEITDSNLREELKPLSWGQSQITDASNLLLFCNKLEVTTEDVDDLIKLNSETNNIPVENLSGYADFMKSKMAEKSPEEMENWTAKQTYIALGTALAACAELKIDSTPMEGFDINAYNEKFGLREKGYSACLVLAIGYRDAEDKAQHSKKFRKSIDELFETI